MKKKWIVIYQGKNKGDHSRSSVPLTKPTAVTLFKTMVDSEYLVKVVKAKI